MTLPRLITILVLLSLSALCSAEDPAQSVPRCDISRLPLTTVEATSDTQGVDFGPYARSMVATIRQNWYARIPPAAMPPHSKRGCVVVEFEIVKSGAISSVRYKLSSGDISLDQAVFNAISAASPLRALPAEFRGPSVTYRFTFKYNGEPEAASGTASGNVSDKAFIYREPALALSNNGPGGSVGISSEKKPDQGIQLGAPIRAVDPVVPKSLYGKNAAAVVGATIETEGSFADLWALGGDQDLEDAALDAVHQWRYAPATLNGSPVETKVFLTFLLNQGEMKTSVEPDLPFPDGPKRDMAELYSNGELFAVDMEHVKPPKAVYSPDPEYSQAARAAKRQGTVRLGLILGPDGSPEDIWVIRKFVYSNGQEKTYKPVGLGLEQKAIEAVRKWRFDPATKDGQPVSVFLSVELAFHAY